MYLRPKQNQARIFGYPTCIYGGVINTLIAEGFSETGPFMSFGKHVGVNNFQKYLSNAVQFFFLRMFEI